MTPDANDVLFFAVKRGNIEKRLDINYYLPKYNALIKKLHNVFGDRLIPLGQLADVICGPFGSAIKNGDYQENGIPLVRIRNISKDGYMDYTDLVYISEQLGDSLARTQVSSGDIVISQRGSLGQCAVVDDKFPKMNISANIIAVKNIKGTTAAFIHDYLLSSFGQQQLERNTSGQVQQKITTQDIAEILVPVGCDEEALCNILLNAYRSCTTILKQSKDLLEFDSSFILQTLGLSTTKYTNNLVSAIRLSSIIDNSIFSAEYYHPERLSAIHMVKSGADLSTYKLCDIVSFHRIIVKSADSNAKFLGLAGVQSQTGELSGVTEDAAGLAFAYSDGDILYGRLRPYLNKVFLAESSGICSTEFHVMRIRDKTKVLPGYLAAILRSELVLSQTKHMLTGNTHPRISNDDVKNLYIPIPKMTVQCHIQDELNKRRLQARIMREKAALEWLEAKSRFEKELLGE